MWKTQTQTYISWNIFTCIHGIFRSKQMHATYFTVWRKIWTHTHTRFTCATQSLDEYGQMLFFCHNHCNYDRSIANLNRTEFISYFKYYRWVCIEFFYLVTLHLFSTRYDVWKINWRISVLFIIHGFNPLACPRRCHTAVYHCGTMG